MNTKGEYENRPLMKLSRSGLRGVVALLFLLPVAAGAGGVVTNCSESALRAAMGGGGVVTFACDGTILLANTITNDNGTTLDASGRQVTISGNNAVRVFYVNTNVSFTVVDLTIADGASLGGSAILNLGGTVSLTGVTFRSNNAAVRINDYSLSPKASGGAIFNRGGAVNASNCSFAGNTAHSPVPGSGFSDALACGGAIRNEAGQLDLRSCAFVGNQAFGGTAYNPLYYPLPGDRGLGGAIHNSGTVRLDLCTLAGNSATGGGGGGNWSNWAGASGGEGSGGAIFNQGTLMMDRTTLCGNTATGGSGGSSPGEPTMGDFRQGSPGGAGGGANGAAICNLGSLWVTRSTFATNVVTGGAGGGGGGGSASPGGGGNGGEGGDGGSGLGGALFNSGAASLVNCTIAFNTGSGGAGGGGGAGAGYNVGSSGAGGWGGNGGSGFGGVDRTCNLTNCTVACNLGHGGSGGVGGAGSGGNPTPGVAGTNGAAWGGTACSTLVNTLIASNTPAGNDTFTDPKLGPLADNGGPTLTMALLPGSLAIDAGNTSLAPATDQRGFPRPAGLAADIGAFEYGSVMPTLAVSRSGATGLRIVASGNAGQSCRLLWSPDLSSWFPMATNQIGGDGTVVFYDDCATNGACRFYRLVMHETLLVIPDLSAWLDAHPRIAGAIKWQTQGEANVYIPPTENDKLAYPNWSQSQKDALNQAYADACNWFVQGTPPVSASSDGLTDEPSNLHPNALDDNVTAIEWVSGSYLWQLYIAHMAFSLALENVGQRPWTITTYTDEQLRYLFDSSVMAWKIGSGVGAGDFSMGTYQMYLPALRADNRPKTAFAPPKWTYQFLKQNHLLGTTRLDTVGNTLQWMRLNMTHFFGAETFGNCAAVWQYRGYPPLSKIVNGTIDSNNPSYGVMHWTMGCHGSVGFLHAVLRAANIPVQPIWVCGHELAWFMTENLYLDHGDDPYNLNVRNSSAPILSVLIDEPTYESWFTTDLTANILLDSGTPCSNVGRRATEIH